MRHPTGEQYEIVLDTSAGVLRAVVTEVAAGLREFSLAGVDIAVPFPVDAAPPGASGIALAPWPNRVRDARWSAVSPDGVRYDEALAVTEPDKANALHGLLRYTPYALVEQGMASVALAATIFPQTGWPFTLDTSVSYALVDDGLVVEHSATNVGAASAPVAFGAHPYLGIGDVPTETLSLAVAAQTHFNVDARLDPVAEVPVEGTRFDLRSPRLVGDLVLDDGFGSAGPGVLAALSAPDGRSVELWGDEATTYLQVFTHRRHPPLPEGAVALALEPMTAPADALNSGTGLRWLAPGESWSARWGIRLAGF
ncbi:aldose 1-epimerase family protein [Gryllotalpicola sp.]|uniref:aldose 1-epimerase family protein n=1 Tax=Gryllotalpicola sp. TaxID=1932787 RepID=UPI00260408AE|nr:aldose 1-epimerase family protein [Gryllotalpicola sp.]